MDWQEVTHLIADLLLCICLVLNASIQHGNLKRFERIEDEVKELRADRRGGPAAGQLGLTRHQGVLEE